MREFIFDNLEHVLFALLLLSRAGDLVTTYLVTPRLELEGNPIARKLGWRFAVLTSVFCLLPYYSVDAAVMVLVPFLFVSAANAGRIWFARAMGETRYKALLYELALKSSLSGALIGTAVSASFVLLSGLILLFLYPDPDADWAYWFSLGIIGYSVVVWLYGSLWLIKLFKDARSNAVAESSGIAEVG